MRPNIENTPNFKQGKAWEVEASSLLCDLGLTVEDTSDQGKFPDLTVHIGRRKILVEAKCFNHSLFNVHKLKTESYFYYMRREMEKLIQPVAYFYWHPKGKHEVYSIHEIGALITNFKNPQHWPQRNEYYFHFPRGTGTPYKKFFNNEDNLKCF